MKMILNKSIREESGQALILVVILLLVGSLIIAPLLGFMNSGIIAGQVHEERMDELYAADAGVELALWQLRSEVLTVPDEGGQSTLAPFNMNDKNVDVTVENIGGSVLKITSEAADGATTVVSYVYSPDFSYFLDNVITSGGDITVHPAVMEIELIATGADVVYNYSDEYWPDAEWLAAHYYKDVDDLEPYPDATLDVADNPIIGPLYRNGDLDIINTGGDITAILNGTVYVTGKLTIATTNKKFTLNLNNKTIFVEDASTGSQQALKIAGGNSGCSLTGSGVIIAIGDIEFKPNASMNPEDFIFAMSVDGVLEAWPMGDFYGSFAGNVEVWLQPGGTIMWPGLPPLDLNFPTGSMQDLEIDTWEVSLT